jgi:tetratricopeptide (TPR) repeat protein
MKRKKLELKRLTLKLLFLCLALNGCTFSADWIRYLRAQRAVMKHDYATALPILKQIVDNAPESKRALESSRQGARVAHLEAKNYPLAVDFYKHIVLQSDDAEERKSAQSFIAQIYFENLLNFEQAVVEFEKLLKLDNTPEEAFRYRMNLAKSHYQMNNLDQSVAELDVLLEKKPDPDKVFEIKSMKANILTALKQVPEAATVWESILKEFPERSAKENVALNLVVCYEDLKEYNKAIDVLEGMRPRYPNPKFLDQKIERLQERRDNLPGAHGWKK